jgi:hypothetical protein
MKGCLSIVGVILTILGMACNFACVDGCANDVDSFCNVAMVIGIAMALIGFIAGGLKK